MTDKSPRVLYRVKTMMRRYEDVAYNYKHKLNDSQVSVSGLLGRKRQTKMAEGSRRKRLVV